MDMEGAHSTFYWARDREIYLADFPGDMFGLYILVCIIVFVIALFVEWLSHSRLGDPGPDDDCVTRAIAQTLVHGVRVVLAFLAMLAVMSYNAGFFISAIAGHMAGFFIFGTAVFRGGREQLL